MKDSTPLLCMVVILRTRRLSLGLVRRKRYWFHEWGALLSLTSFITCTHTPLWITLPLGQGAPRGVPIYRTTPFVFKSTEHAANLFALKELGNIYSRLGNPTNHVLESRYALLEGGHPLAGLAVASGTNAIFYAVLGLAQQGDNIVAATALYGGTHTWVLGSTCFHHVTLKSS